MRPFLSGRVLVRPGFPEALAGLFLLLALLGILHHEMWRDELQAWLLARDSASVPALLHEMRFEGHPALWHLLLFPLTRMSADPLLMQILHVGIATASVYVIARFSPFGPLEKCLLAFGYFAFYEYALISRSYSLGMLLVFLFCALQASEAAEGERGRGLATIARFGLLATLANTSVYGLFISVALSIALLRPGSGMRRGSKRSPRLLGGALLIGGWALCIVQVNRINVRSGAGLHIVEEVAASGAREPLGLLTHVFGTVSQIWRSYVPVPAFWSDRPWNSNFLADAELFDLLAGKDVAKALALVGSLLLVAVVCRLLRHRPAWLAVYAVGTTLHLAFGFLYFDGMIRHHGHLFVLLVACLWLLRAEDVRTLREEKAGDPARGSPSPRSPVRRLRLQSRFLTTLLAFHFVAGAYFYAFDWVRPFSGGEAAATLIREQRLDHLPLVGYRDRETSTLSAYLDRPIYYPNRGMFGSYWTEHREGDPAAVDEAIRAFVLAHDGPVVIVLTEPATLRLPNTKLERLTYVQGEFARRESFHVYLATPR